MALRNHLENVPYSSVLSKSHNMFLKVIYSRSHYPITSSTTFNYVIFSDSILISALVLVTQEIPIIVDSYLLINYSTFMSRSPRPIVTQLDNNTFPTLSPHMVRYRSICHNYLFKSHERQQNNNKY